MDADRVPTRFARSLLNLVKEREADYAGMLAVAGIEFDPLDSRSPGFDESISPMQYTKLYQQVLDLLQDEAFGLFKNRGLTPGAFRMMCYCILGCDNLGKAIKRAVEFYRTFFEAEAQIAIEVRDGIARVGYTGTTGRAAGAAINVSDVYGLSAWHRFYCWLIGSHIDLETVRFQGGPPEPAKDAKYQALFACPIEYHQERHEFLFNARYLDNPLVHTEQSLKDFLRSAPYQLMVIPTQGEGDGLVARVKAMIGHDFSQGLPGFERVCEALNMSAPTLRRRLRKEGTSFQQLKDETRQAAAEAYLLNSDLSINAIAALMGFTDPSAFHRCFKKWTGQTPGDFRLQKQ